MNEIQKNIVEAAKKYTKDFLKDDISGHDYFHIKRVLSNAQKLLKDYKANEFVVTLAAILHDLDDYKISITNSNNVVTFLNKYNIDEKEQIMTIINNMSFSSFEKGSVILTIEGKIVQDADRLDAIGAIGIARCFAYSGSKNQPIYLGDKDDKSAIAHFYKKLLKLPALMNTEKAQLLAQKKLKIMNNFLADFFQEWIDE